MKHIVQLKRDNGVLYLRIPAIVVKALKIWPKEYYVLQVDPSGNLRYKPLRKELGAGHGIKAGKSR